jgi:Putative 2OG-Fe(II) oxygenase
MPFVNQPNVGFLVEELNPFVFQRLKKECLAHKQHFEENNKLETSKDLLRAFHKRKLGYTSQYGISPETNKLLTTEICKLIDRFEDKYDYFGRLFNYTVNVEQRETVLELERLWVNFQRPTEFLPLHNHTGLYSFVIWIHIPFDIKDERDTETNAELVNNRTSNFEFIYLDALGKISAHALNIDKQWEGKVAIFPSEMYHQVYPFYTSDDVRISVAGNIRLAIKE